MPLKIHIPGKKAKIKIILNLFFFVVRLVCRNFSATFDKENLELNTEILLYLTDQCPKQQRHKYIHVKTLYKMHLHSLLTADSLWQPKKCLWKMQTKFCLEWKKNVNQTIEPLCDLWSHNWWQRHWWQTQTQGVWLAYPCIELNNSLFRSVLTENMPHIRKSKVRFIYSKNDVHCLSFVFFRWGWMIVDCERYQCLCKTRSRTTNGTCTMQKMKSIVHIIILLLRHLKTHSTRAKDFFFGWSGCQLTRMRKAFNLM